MTTRILLAASALSLAACTPDFDPASQVDKLRVLAVRADPPEIAPAPSAGGAAAAPESAALTALVLRGDFAADPLRSTTVVYLACVPVPGDPTPSPCVVLASLRDPTAVLAGAAQASCEPPLAGAAPPAVAFAGVEVCHTVGAPCAAATIGGAALASPSVAVPAGYGFDSLPPGAPERILGVEAVVLAFALDASPEELAAGASGACPAASIAQRFSELWTSREHVLSTKRVRIRGPEAPDAPNQNPAIDGIAADGTALDRVAPGTIQLTPVLPAGAVPEPYTKLDAAGAAIESTVEEWVYSWFSTAGELADLHTRADASEEWKVEAAPGGRALVAAVVRDLRGGTAWTVREVAIGP